MSRFLFMAVLAFILIPYAASASISCTRIGSTVTCNDTSLPDVPEPAPFKGPNNTSAEDQLKAQYGLTNFYSCVRSTDYLSHTGGPDVGIYLGLLKVCLERKVMYPENIQLEKTPVAPSCPVGTYAQGNVCIQTVIQQVQPQTPAQDNNSICRDDYGPYSTWSGETNDQGGLVCACPQGYEVQGGVCTFVAQQQVYAEPESCTAGTSYDGTACVKNETRCVSGYGLGSTWDGTVNDEGGPQCACRTGYELNKAQTMCEKAANFDLVFSGDPKALGEGSITEASESKGWFRRLVSWLVPW